MPRKPRQLQQQVAAIKAARGSLRRKPGGPSFAERMAAFNAEERALEQRREDCLMSIGAGKSSIHLPQKGALLHQRLCRARQKGLKALR